MGVKEILKKVENSKGMEYDRKKPNMLVIWAIIIAVIILAMGNFKVSDKALTEESKKSGVTDNYEKEQEERLERVLKKIDGAGDVTVYIKFDDGGEIIPAKDIKSSIDESGENRKTESEEIIVISGKGSDSQPFTVKERKPQASGALIVATGAANESVRIKIYEAVRAIYGIAPHRIQVTY